MKDFIIPFIPEIIIFIAGFVCGGSVVERALSKKEKENKNPKDKN